MSYYTDVMAGTSAFGVCECADECSENELLNQSLSVWKGWGTIENEAFIPIPLDLYTASSIGQYECVRHIVQRHEQDLNKPNKGGWTPLMYACYIGHDNIVRTLLEAGASINIQNTKGQRALHLACSSGNESVTSLLLKAGAALEERDYKGWTALFHATYSGHQNMVTFLLKNGAHSEVREPHRGFTPFIEAAVAGHEIIVQYFLLHGVNVNAKALSGHTARSLALDHGHTKIVSMIDNHILSPSMPLRSEAGLMSTDDWMMSDGCCHRKRSPWNVKNNYKGPSIQDGPAALNKVLHQKRDLQAQHLPCTNPVETRGYLTFQSSGVQPGATNQIRFRDVTSPIKPEDHPFDGSGGQESLDQEEETSAFTKTGALTIKSSSGSSGGLIAALGLSQSNSDEGMAGKSTENQSVLQRSLSDSVLKGLSNQSLVPHDDGHHVQKTNTDTGDVTGSGHACMVIKTEYPANLPAYPVDQVRCDLSLLSPNSPRVFPDGQTNVPQNRPVSMIQHPLWHPFGTLSPPGMTTTDLEVPHTPLPNESDQRCKVGLSTKASLEQKKVMEEKPRDLATLLHQLGLSKYQLTFDEQDVDLQVFLSLTDNDLKEIGIKLFGPRRKMTNAIARWHSNARPSGNDLEQAYADKLEADMQEMAIQLKLAKETVSQLKLQVEEERELRSVTENCLIENGLAWNRVTSLARNTDRICHSVEQHLHALRLYHSELTKRVGMSSEACLTGSVQQDSLSASLRKALQREEECNIGLDVCSERRTLSTPILLQRLCDVTDDVTRLVTEASVSVSELLNVSPSSVTGGYS